MRPFIGIGCMLAANFVSIMVILLYGYKCYIHVKTVLPTTSQSSQFKNLQTQLFYALFFQTLIPIILMHTPAFFIFIATFMDRSCELLGQIPSITIVLYPSLDPLPNIFIIRNYRDATVYYVKSVISLVFRIPGSKIGTKDYKNERNADLSRYNNQSTTLFSWTNVLVIVGTKDKLFGPAGLTVLNSFYWGCFGASMAVFAVHFVYRWLVVSENPLLGTFNGWKIWIWFSIPLWYGLTWVCTGYFLSAPNDSTSKFIRENVKEIFELEFDEYIYLGPFLYERMENGTVILHIVPFIVVGIIPIIPDLINNYRSFVWMPLLCPNQQYRCDDSEFSQNEKSSETIVLCSRHSNSCSFHFDAYSCCNHVLFVFLDIDLGVYSAVVSITIAIYPAVDPIPTLVIVENYRKTILKFFGCFKKKSLLVTTTIQPTIFIPRTEATMHL
ncbi:hypothetical protein CRE_15141 [Caenorhabditis remanei]|uniref:Uncharacterized protein n=1 Tax=Caenorhabditis remanei TaxID=31234 RepID=E3NSZ5_CAERE|nr:hypothetical protein CRE_15141 [Caenorhabditis remanei]